MKKFLLTTAILALTATASLANVETLVFDGEGDAYGITRQNTIDVNQVEFVQEISFTQSGIDFSLTKATDTGLGFALVDGGGINCGLFIYSALAANTHIVPHFELTVPGGKISAVKLRMSGSYNNTGLLSLDIAFNGKNVEPEKDYDLYSWNWSDNEGCESVAIQWNNTYYLRYVHSIEVTYTADLGGKEDSGLAFNTEAAEAIIGEPFEAPVLSNPHDLPLIWSSSNENVATVNADGELTLLAGGKTFISVATDGNDEYAAGNTGYQLTVVPAASNIAQLKEMAPADQDRVKVNFPVTVNFANLSYAFVTDAEGNAACFQNMKNAGSTSTSSQTIYKVGDVIPAGWIATDFLMYENMIWQGLPGEVTETVEVEYPTVDAVTPADVDRVVILQAVDFATGTPSSEGRAFGTTPDGTSYEFQNPYGVEEYKAGKYDVTVLVKYSKRGDTTYFFLAPIAFTEYNGVEMAESDTVGARYYDLLGREVKNPGAGLYIKISNGKAEKVMVK